MLLYTFVYMFLCIQMFSFLLGIYLRVKLVVHKVTLCLIVQRTYKLFSKVAALFYIPTSSI